MTQESKTDPRSRGASVAFARRRRLSDYYQALVRRIRGGANGSGLVQAVGVTGCGRRAGVTTVAVNVAVSAAHSGIERVLLIDANVGQRSVERVFRLRPAGGLVDALCSRADPIDCACASNVDNLFVILAGGSKRCTEPIYEPDRITSVLEDLKHRFGFIVVDLPPATGLTPCCALAGKLDGVVVVIEADRVDCRAALQAKQQLDEVNANLIGVVFNKHHNHAQRWFHRRF